MNYGFVFPGNNYDSYEVLLRLDSDLSQPFVPNLIDLNGDHDKVEECRLKTD